MFRYIPLMLSDKQGMVTSIFKTLVCLGQGTEPRAIHKAKSEAVSSVTIRKKKDL